MAKQAHQRLRKPANLYADAPAQIIEFDMKHVYLLGIRCYDSNCRERLVS